MSEPGGATHLASGKVREIYALDDERLLLVASDRISTFDVILPTPIPDKGRVLTGMSAFWFARTSAIVPNHLLELGDDGRSTDLPAARDAAGGVRRARLPVGLVVGRLPGVGIGVRPRLAAGAASSPTACPTPIVTPATKAEEGHDLNITEAEAAALCGAEAYEAAREGALGLYAFASAHAEARGIVLADTKFEFGVDPDGVVTLGDEALTPDSSRFWPGDSLCARAARSRRSTSSTCATTASRPGGIAPIPAPRCPRTSCWARVPATSTRSSG